MRWPRALPRALARPVRTRDRSGRAGTGSVAQATRRQTARPVAEAAPEERAAVAGKLRKSAAERCGAADLQAAAVAGCLARGGGVRRGPHHRGDRCIRRRRGAMRRVRRCIRVRCLERGIHPAPQAGHHRRGSWAPCSVGRSCSMVLRERGEHDLQDRRIAFPDGGIEQRARSGAECWVVLGGEWGVLAAATRRAAGFGWRDVWLVRSNRHRAGGEGGQVGRQSPARARRSRVRRRVKREMPAMAPRTAPPTRRRWARFAFGRDYRRNLVLSQGEKNGYVGIWSWKGWPMGRDSYCRSAGEPKACMCPTPSL